MISNQQKFIIRSELKTLEWDILNPDRLIIWRLITRGEQALFNLEIKKKSGFILNPDIHLLKVPSAEHFSICKDFGTLFKMEPCEGSDQSLRNPSKCSFLFKCLII